MRKKTKYLKKSRGNRNAVVIIKVMQGVKLANQMHALKMFTLLEGGLKLDSQLSREQCE